MCKFGGKKEDYIITVVIKNLKIKECFISGEDKYIRYGEIKRNFVLKW